MKKIRNFSYWFDGAKLDSLERRSIQFFSLICYFLLPRDFSFHSTWCNDTVRLVVGLVEFELWFVSLYTHTRFRIFFFYFLLFSRLRRQFSSSLLPFLILPTTCYHHQQQQAQHSTLHQLLNSRFCPSHPYSFPSVSHLADKNTFRHYLLFLLFFFLYRNEKVK